MRSLSPLAAFLATIIALAGCNGTVESPVGPSGSAGTSFTPPPPPAPQPAPPEIAGTIAVRSIAPEPGTTMIVRNCMWAEFPYLCANELRLAFDVQVDQDIPAGVLSADFTAAGSTCAHAYASERVTLTTGTQATIRMQGAEISSDGALFRCPLPAETTQMVVRLTGEGRVLLTREFAYTYRFVLE